MSHFFTKDTSPENHPIIELQQQAMWIGVALILQALNEIPRKYYISYRAFLKALVRIHSLHPGIGKPGSNVHGIPYHHT